MADRTRQTNRVNFRGLNTVLAPDALPLGKSPAAVNIRADGDSKIKTRPGLTADFATGNVAPTDLRAYTALGTDNQPRIIVHDSGGGVWLDDGVQKGTVGTGGVGASMIPFRPNQSPQSWLYLCNGTGYKKFSAPDSSNNVTAYKVGIAEPQSAPEACPDGFQYNDFTATHASWTNGGTAGGPSDVTRSTDAVVAIFQDPASVSPASKIRYSVQVGTGVQYQAGELLKFNKSSGGTVSAVIEDVYPPINTGAALTIQDILYLNGPTGLCVIVPSQLPIGSLNASASSASGDPTAQLPALAAQVAALRRGSLIQFGGETVFVRSVTVGPQHQIAIECYTTGTHVAGETIIGIPAVCCSGISSVVVGQTVVSAQINSSITKGVGTLTQTLGTNPFNLSLGTIGTPQEDDTVHISLTFDLPQNVTEAKVIFDIDDGSFTKNILYFPISASLLEAAISNAQTQQDLTTALGQNQVLQQSLVNAGYSTTAASQSNIISYDPITGKTVATLPQSRGGFTITLFLPTASGVGQYTEVTVSIASLIRSGNDQTKTLANCAAVQVLANVAGTTTIGFGSLWVGGGGQPDVGTNGAPYVYRVVPRSSTTGVKGNPSPAMRYGVAPRAQSVILSLPSASYDSQIDTWDIERYGGSVTSFRYIGSASSSASTYVDNALDSAALAGSLLEFDNFEPWPSVDVPYSATVGSGGVSSITIYGTAIVILGSTFPATITRWLPGTLLTLDGQYVYTLQNRPVSVSGGYMFRTIENASAPTVTTLTVQEPIVANQSLPYLWGPDANGVVFGVGDPLRPGVLYSAKQNNPDATPNNVYDVVPPSEPLLGGEVIDGLGLVASSKRWFQIQAAFNSAQRWLLVETPAGRGLAAPYGHCTDGKQVYFWAKDGIYAMVPGLPAISLTDQDIENLFPTDGIDGANIAYNGTTFYAPDYSRAAQFRISIINSFLRAHYLDSNGNHRVLILDMNLMSDGKPRMAWSSDEYPDGLIISSYQAEQPSGTLTSVPGSAYKQGYFLGRNGRVYTESDLTNDAGIAIPCVWATNEDDARDARVLKKYLDAMVDVIPASGLTVQPTFKGASVGTLASVAASLSRSLSLAPLGYPIANFLGLLFAWTDNFSTQSAPTTLLEWSTEFVPQPVQILTWQSVPTSHGLKSYHFVYKIVFAYMSSAPVTLTLTAYDGTSPVAVVLPSTSGAYQKTEFRTTFNKGMLFAYQGSSAEPWAPVLEECEVHVGEWGRSGPCSIFRGLGGIEAQ